MAKVGIVQLSKMMTTGEISLPGYYHWLLGNVQERDTTVRALLPEGYREARLDQERQRLLDRLADTGSRPPLFGIPLGVKDIFHVEGLETRAGSELPPNELKGKEAKVVSQLKAAGAIVFAKTVTTEFAYFAPGPTRNPYSPDHTPGGSSSGSAAAVGAGMLPLALGTQTIGSITRPAGFCGAVGYKPSYDRLSRSGVIPLSPSVDHVGFFVGNVDDAKLVASVLLERWKSASPKGLPRLGIPKGPYLGNASQAGLTHFENVRAHLLRSGFEVESVPVMNDFEDIQRRHHRIVAAEAAKVHKEWFAKYGGRYHPKTEELIRKGMEISAEDLEAALDGRAELREELAGAAKREGIDLWITPSAPGAAPEGIESTGDPVMNLPWTHAGLPSISLPSGFNRAGLPYGLQVVGAWMEDEALLSWAKVLERVLPIN